MTNKEVTVEVVSGKVAYRDGSGKVVRVTPESKPNTLKVRESKLDMLKPLVRVVGGGNGRGRPKKAGGSDGASAESQDSGAGQVGGETAGL